MYIRDFTPSDYPALTALHNAIYPGRARTPEGWAAMDQQRHPKCKFHRWVAVEDDAVVGTGVFDQDITDYDPYRFYVDFKVAPGLQRRGIGSALFQHVMAELQPFEPQVLRANAYEDQPQGLEFMLHRGFYEAWRETPVRLNLTTVDLTPYQGMEDKLHLAGYQIKTLLELEGDPERKRKLYDLYWTLDKTLPREERTVVQQPSFEEWSDLVFDNPEVPQDGYFVTTRGDDYVGLKELGIDTSTNMIWSGLMGVLPEHRRHGIGMAMQVRAIAYARDKGYPFLTSSTGTVNQAMQAIYSHLGYFRLPLWYQLQKDIL